MNRNIFYNGVFGLVSLTLLTLISIALGMIISYIFGDDIWFLVEPAFKNGLYLGLVLLLSVFVAHLLVFRLKNILILLLGFGIMLGADIIYLGTMLVINPVIFLYSNNRSVSLLLVNLLFFSGINVISVGSVIFQKTVSAKEMALKEEKFLKQQMELKLLSAKLNPHFLFNSLNLIISLLKQPAKAEEALINLSDLLRYSLEYTDQKQTTLKEELRQVAKYLAIQTMRFDDRLTYRITGSEMTDAVPPFIIQPLVENCIKHNIDAVDRLTVTVDVTRMDGRIRIRVTDSCLGLTDEMLDRGQGLTITKKRVESQGGCFAIENGGVTITYSP